MGVTMGKGGYIFVAAATAASATSAIANIDTWTLDMTVDAVETTAFGTSAVGVAARTFEPGLKGATGSLSGHYDDASVHTNWLMEIMADTTIENVNMDIYLNASQLFSFGVCLTGVSLGATMDGKTTFSANYTVDGAITLT